jgi:hypothetical protein
VFDVELKADEAVPELPFGLVFAAFQVPDFQRKFILENILA